MNIIEGKNLTKDYGSGRGVFDVSFSVNTGEVFGFWGPNGARKSTTIRHLMGFSKPDSGETFLFGKPTFEKYSDYALLARSGSSAVSHREPSAGRRQLRCLARIVGILALTANKRECHSTLPLVWRAVRSSNPQPLVP